MEEKITYKSAGVDKEAGYESVRLIKEMVKSTYTKYVMGDLGSFGGCVEIPEGHVRPVLVSGTDGVGTKLVIAQQMDVHNTVGIDLVAMCANDVLCHGAAPLYFLDYIACGKNEPKRIAELVRGVTAGCLSAGCALIGGETAEMPGMYDPDEYDLAGFCTGIVEKDKFITGERVGAGDVLVGLRSSGLHSNGFSLVRKILFDKAGYRVDSNIDELGASLGEVLLTPTEIYANDILALRDKVDIHGMSHITGGGYIENVPRMIPDGLCAMLDVRSVFVPPIFGLLARLGGIEPMEMFSTFNMGIGFVVAVDKADEAEAMDTLSKFGHAPIHLGKVEQGSEKICLKY